MDVKSTTSGVERRKRTRELPFRPRAAAQARGVTTARSLSVIIPTFNERENIEILTRELLASFELHQVVGEIIVVDDASPDGTGRFVEELSLENRMIRVIHRSGKLGLGSAVIEGFGIAHREIIGVMDADLSHPTSALPRMLDAMKGDVDFVIGSRYIEGGETVGWPLKRRIISRLATFLARPFTSVRDPMSGFFLIRRHCLNGLELSTRGFKICLDLLVRADYRSVTEVPISFVERRHGKSKLGKGEVFNLLASLASYTFGAGKRRNN